MGISETIKDTKMVKLGKTCAIKGLLSCCKENKKIPITYEDIPKKPKFADFVFIFF